MARLAPSKDIAIIGGGLIGLCAALILQHPRRSVAVIEAADIRQPSGAGLNARSIAVSASSVQIFRAIGIWPQLAEQATPIRNIHVSSQGHWGRTQLQAQDYDLEALGYVIQNAHLSDCLLRAAEASPRINLQQPAEFESIELHPDLRVKYRVGNNQKILPSKLGLIADGAHSSARAALDIPHQQLDYQQSAVICNIRVSQPRVDFAFERFTSQGPLAVLPLGGDSYACVWTLAPDNAEQNATLDDDAFIASLQDCFGYRLGMIREVGERFAFPIHRTHAQQLQRANCVLIGNAANALHPVAGQGFNLALRDLACLYELLLDRSLVDLNDEAICAIAQQYEIRRQAEHGKVIRYGDGLVSLFSNELPLLRNVRAAGLSLLDLLPALKTQVALSGMGMTFGGNRLLRGHR